MTRQIMMIVLPALLSLNLESTALAAPIAGWGRVNMAGSIIDTACAIEAGSLDQTIDMGVNPMSQLVMQDAGGNRHWHGQLHTFTIRLIDCVLQRGSSNIQSRTEWQHYQITFDGANDGDNFNVDGDARGVALQIRDQHGNLAHPGEPMPRGSLISDNQDLLFSLSLTSNQKTLRAGEFRSTLRFRMDYD